MHSFLQRTVLCLLLFVVHSIQAQVQFSSTISPSRINKDDYAELQLKVENAKSVEQIVPPSLKDFIIVSGPNQMSGMTSINGNVKQYIALTYMIKPKGPGSFDIGSGTAKADGKDYKSNGVHLDVSNSLSGNNRGSNSLLSPFAGMDPFEDAAPATPFNDYILRKGENAFEKVSRNMIVKAEVNKTSCYVGEPLVVTYKLYTRLKSESNLTKNPSFNGFSVIDLQPAGNNAYSIEKLNGREYNVYTLRKVQAYPLQASNLELESVEMENKVRFIKEEYAKRQLNDINDIFRDFAETTIPPEGMEEQKVILKSKPVTILVKPLPDANKPVSFKGAVGKFEIRSALEKNKFTTDDVGKLLLVINGEGNLQLVNSPQVKWPAGIESFEPKATDDIDKFSVPVRGKKLFEFDFTVAEPGEYTLAPVEFSYFDAAAQQYKTTITEPLNFSVTRGTGKPREQQFVDTSTSKERFLNKVLNHREWIAGVVAFLIILGLFFWVRRDHRKEKKEKAQALAMVEPVVTEEISFEKIPDETNPLEAAEKLMVQRDDQKFFESLNHSFKEFLSQRLDVPIEQLNKKTVIEQLDKRGVSNETSLQVQQLLDEIEWRLYTPFHEAGSMQELYDKASDLVEMLNTYKTRHG